ncbi:MAG: hypothetical protein E4H18_05930 [Hyphomicrobiales bacterium]|nr:MAG: hypothetical protein E4H18_05930 [Hyphomicrobiales bacterium]
MLLREKAQVRHAAASRPKRAATRRTLLGAGLIAVVVATAAAPLVAALPPARQIAFAILSDDDVIGHHSITFERRGGDLLVDIDIGIEVRFAFFTLFRYQHENLEVWRDGQLVSLDTRTDDDGTLYAVTARATPAGLQVEGANGTFLAPKEIIPTSYWNPATVEQTRLLDTQSGRLLGVTIRPSGEDSLTVGSAAVPAHKYTVTGDLNLDVWYTPQGEWAKISFETRGTTIDYAPAEVWARQLGGSK